MVSVSDYIPKVGQIQHAVGVGAPPPSMTTQLGHLGRSNSR